MDCPLCKHTESRVLRTKADADGITRRRRCDRCGHGWTTSELPAEALKRLQDIAAAVRHLQGLPL